MFDVRKNRHPALDGQMWGWVERQRDGKHVALWASWRDWPTPGCAPGGHVEPYQAGYRYATAGRIPDIRWRITDAAGRHVLTSIDNEDTARELLAWLCPAPKE